MYTGFLVVVKVSNIEKPLYETLSIVVLCPNISEKHVFPCFSLYLFVVLFQSTTEKTEDTVFVNLLQACSKLMFQTTLWSLLRFIDPDALWLPESSVLILIPYVCW